MHCCCICGALGPWTEAWSWYGSVRDEDGGDPLPKFCSKVCRHRGGPRAVNVTPEMRIAAQKAERRPPKIAYREATENEKYKAALNAQRDR